MIVNGIELKKLTHDGHKVKKWTHDGVKVWSGATVVSYYDGDTLIGTEEVDEGADVLHPSLSLSKEGYTHVGWTYQGNDVTSLEAVGETMAVMAVYLPNTLIVARGAMGGWNYNGTAYYQNYSVFDKNESYFSGDMYSTAQSAGASTIVDKTFTLSLGKYSKASGVFATTSKKVNQTSHSGYGMIDSITITSEGTSTVDLSAGNHTLRAYVFPSSGWETRYTYVSRITLSEPQAWI